MRPDPRRRRVLAALLTALAAPPALALDLDELMGLLQQRRSV
jgi:hypothetical protein